MGTPDPRLINHAIMSGEVMSGRKVVIIGTGETGAAMFEYFSHDSEHEIVAFSAERPYITDGLICGCRVVPLDELAATYPPSDYCAFVAVSMTGLNRVRRRLYAAVKAMGFQCVSFISSRASLPPAPVLARMQSSWRMRYYSIILVSATMFMFAAGRTLAIALF